MCGNGHHHTHAEVIVGDATAPVNSNALDLAGPQETLQSTHQEPLEEEYLKKCGPGSRNDSGYSEDEDVDPLTGERVQTKLKVTSEKRRKRIVIIGLGMVAVAFM